jgi:D-galactarolactone cycloisomerase
LASALSLATILAGGISELRKLLVLAEAANVTVAPHSPYFGPGLLGARSHAAFKGSFNRLLLLRR